MTKVVHTVKLLAYTLTNRQKCFYISEDDWSMAFNFLLHDIAYFLFHLLLWPGYELTVIGE